MNMEIYSPSKLSQELLVEIPDSTLVRKLEALEYENIQASTKFPKD